MSTVLISRYRWMEITKGATQGRLYVKMHQWSPSLTCAFTTEQ